MKDKKQRMGIFSGIFSVLFENSEEYEDDKLPDATEEEKNAIFQSWLDIKKLEHSHGGMQETSTQSKSKLDKYKQNKGDAIDQVIDASSKLYPNEEEQKLLKDADKFERTGKSRAKSRDNEGR